MTPQEARRQAHKQIDAYYDARERRGDDSGIEAAKEKFRETIMGFRNIRGSGSCGGILMGPMIPLPEGYHGRWDWLSVEDIKFLIKCGISID
jgi:hypothetical protein